MCIINWINSKVIERNIPSQFIQHSEHLIFGYTAFRQS